MTAAKNGDRPRRHVVRKETVLVACDIVAALGCSLLALEVRFAGDVPPEHWAPYLLYSPVLVAWRLLVAQYAGLYDFRHRIAAADHGFAAIGAALGAVVPGYLFLAMVQLYYPSPTHLSRLVAIIDLGLLAVWFAISRLVVLGLLTRLGYRIRVLLIGPIEACRAFAAELRRDAPAMIEISGIATPTDETEEDEVLGSVADLDRVIARAEADTAVICGQSLTQQQLRDVLVHCDLGGVEAFLHPDVGLALIANTSVSSMAGLPLVPLVPALATSPYRIVKRAIDIGLSVAVLLLGAPLWFAVAWAIRRTSAGPALFSQERVGTRGHLFRVWKWRTMVDDAEAKSGPVLSSSEDPRVTPLGRVLRRYRIDEIPQFWNVLRGEMSLVGPRPERPVFVEEFTHENPLYERRNLVRPGLTGLAQVHVRYDADYAQKLRYDLIYINAASLAMDLRILWATLRTVVTGKGTT
ncbi:MAG TPA: sugar transferase [Candidatus Hydrogenedentes bacterium]|nr:sugar transferase [Candidatus Hydrogenedentota bacterium]HPG68633.1 sugar transferase [Candidatus Hydrogenedentota bacterium]